MSAFSSDLENSNNPKFLGLKSLKNLQLTAAFTIEAAVIVPISMFIMVAMILISFSLHDKAVMSSESITAILGNYSKDTDIQELKNLVSQELSDKLIISSDPVVTAEEQENGLVLNISADSSRISSISGGILESDPGSSSTQISISNLNGRSVLIKFKAARDGFRNLIGEDTDEESDNDK